MEPAKRRTLYRKCFLTLTLVLFLAVGALSRGYAGDPARGVCAEGDCVNGKGTFRYADGTSYTGQFREGKRHGEGVFTLPNNDIYTGQFADDLFNGFGSYRFSDGARYEGQFAGGVYHGFGVYFFQDGSKKEGLWRSGGYYRPLGEGAGNSPGKEGGKTNSDTPASGLDGPKR